MSNATGATDRLPTAAPAERLIWRAGRIVENRAETASAHTIVFDVPGWPGHLPGQHVDLRLTADDGYSTQRSYSIASASDGTRLELTVQRIDDGEVSTYLTDVVTPGDLLELRGPVGGWFVWRAQDPRPAFLVGGGSGVVPLMAMIRTREIEGSTTPMRLVYSVRTPADVLYADELERRAARGHDLSVTFVYTRSTPPGWPRAPGRIDRETLEAGGFAAPVAPSCFVCGPTGLVEHVAALLVAAGHAPERVRTERFGPTGP